MCRLDWISSASSRESSLRGSIWAVSCTRELAELLPFLTSVWLMPAVFPASKEEIRRKFAFLRDMLERLGVPLFDESLQSLVDQFFDQLPELE